MDWQTRLISIYVLVCDIFSNQGFCFYLQRTSNNKSICLTDEEVLTIYIFGILSHRRTVKQIHSFAFDHLKSWFPNLICYERFVRRLDEMGESLPAFLEILLQQKMHEEFKSRMKLIDSFPIIIAGPKRSNGNSTCSQIADKGYCASKGLYYYGVKLHILGSYRQGQLPLPEFVGLTSASEHDLNAFQSISGELSNVDIFGDKAYCDNDTRQDLSARGTQLATPVKLNKKQKKLDSADNLYSKAVSSIRQPIESFFSWIEEKTGIQRASKIRSYKGLMVHVFGRLAAALIMLS